MTNARTKASVGAVIHPIRWDLVEESLETGDFLWRRWLRAMAAPDHTPADVTRFVEERLLGCVEGLCVAGDAAIERVLAPALEGDAPALQSVAALALAQGSDAAWSHLAAALIAAPAQALSALARGIALVDSDDVVARLESHAAIGAANARPGVLAAFLEICSFRRRPPRAPLDLFAGGGDPAVQRAALGVARFLPRPIAEPMIANGLRLPPPVGWAAVESGLVLGLPAAASACAEAIRALPADGGPLLLAYALAGAGAADRERRKLVDALGVEGLAAAAVWALGFAGTRDAAEACVELMRQERHAPLAFEAFLAITGADAQELGAGDAAPPAPAVLPALADDDLTADLTPTPEESLPEPDADAVAGWWARERDRFAPGTRHLLGRPNDPAALRQALHTAPMRRRPALALDLAIQTRGAQQLNALAFCREQRREMRSWAAGGAPAASLPLPAPATAPAWAPSATPPRPAAPPVPAAAPPQPVYRQPVLHPGVQPDVKAAVGGRRPAVPRKVVPRKKS